MTLQVKNSWSTHWGDGGYFKVARDVRHACGVASDASYAVVADGVAAE
jgi:cathepsin L